MGASTCSPKRAGLLEDGVRELGGEFGVHRQRRELLHPQQFTEYESQVFERCVVHEIMTSLSDQ
jgi:hypothetical protein